MSDRLQALIGDLRLLPDETNWLEFKHNNFHPDEIGKRISAISNAARSCDKTCGYIVWGVSDKDKKIIGTTFDPNDELIQKQPYEFIIAQRLKPSINLSFSKITIDDKKIVILEIPAATISPVEYNETAFIRIGSATPKLSQYPERLKDLWIKLQPYAWETGIAKHFISVDELFSSIDYPSYFDLTNQTLPENRGGILDKLSADKLITKDVGDRWNITNLGAILFAKQLNNFDSALSRKAVRFISFNGTNRASIVNHRQEGQRGYAAGFEGLIEYINGLLPQNEAIETALRVTRPLYPPIAIRELVANALIHQDMTISGAGPLIEMFADRIEITNPGTPLMEPDRFIDTPPQSRNESLAALMRRMAICEEQGTGIDKVVDAAEVYQLPAPEFRSEKNAMRVTLYAPRSFSEMSAAERIRACYQHAVLKYVSGEKMKNSSLRKRLGVESQNAAQISNIFKQTSAQGLIKAADNERPQSGYIPYWA